MADKTSQFSLPPDYHDFLKAFIMNVLDNKPTDLVNYAALYFKGYKDSRDRKRRQVAEEKLAAYGVHLTTFICSEKIDEEELWHQISQGRRKAIAAPSIDPKLLDQQIPYEEKTDEQIKYLKTAFTGVSLLQQCSNEQTETIINAMFQRKVVKGEKIVKQGDEGDNFYLIEKGEFVFHIEFGDYCIKKVMKGKGSFGELALLYECPRTASVEAVSDGVLWCLDQVTFKLILVKESAAKLNTFEEILKNSKLLAMLTYEERMRLVDALILHKYNDGCHIIRKFENSEGMFFIIDGRVKITDGRNDKEIARLQTGDCFGELALGTKDLQKTNVIAVGDVTCAEITTDVFERLLGPYKQLIERNLKDFHNGRSAQCDSIS